MTPLKIISLKDTSRLESEVALLSAKVEELTAIVRKQNQLNLEKGICIITAEDKYFVKVSQLIMIEADGAYSCIHCDGGKKIFTSKTLKYWQEKFNTSQLLRVHQSYLVHRDKIVIMNNGKNIFECAEGLCGKFSRRMKRDLMDRFVKL